MAKRASVKLKGNPLSQFLIVACVGVILVAVYESATRNIITNVLPTQLFILAAVLGVLGLYLKDEKF